MNVIIRAYYISFPATQLLLDSGAHQGIRRVESKSLDLQPFLLTPRSANLHLQRSKVSYALGVLSQEWIGESGPVRSGGGELLPVWVLSLEQS